MKVIGNIIKAFITIISTLVMLVIGTFLYARFIEPNMLIAKKVNITQEQISVPFKLVFFSDTHFGKMYPQENIEKIVKEINRQDADIVVFGGDFFDNYYKEKESLDLEYIMEQLAKIEANYKKYAIWGNHDCGGGSSRIYAEMMETGGFTLLQNETSEIEKLNIQIRGLDDYLLGNPDISTKMLGEGSYNIILSHAPDIVDEMDGSRTDLMVAGHSHGGQIYIPKLTNRFLPDGAKKYNKGLYLFENDRNSKLYVSKGIGVTKMPYRFLNVPEILVIQFQPEP